MTITIELTDNTVVELSRAGTAGLHQVRVGLAVDGAITIHTYNSVEVPGLGMIGESRLVADHPGPMRIGGPVAEPAVAAG